MKSYLIEAAALHKRFGQNQAVDGLDLKIPAGEIYGLVGADGAGKTTTLRLLVGALALDSGQVAICGHDLRREAEQARACVGYLSQRFSLYDDLTVLENIRFFAEVRGIAARDWRPRCMAILEFVGLAAFKDRRAGLLSGGMKQKLGLASALVARPRVLLLDEPTTGVDPLTRQDFWQLLFQLAAETAGGGVAVILSTPYMDEAARCNRIGFMRRGRLISEGAPGELRGLLDERILELHGSPLRLLKQIAAQERGVENVGAFGDRLHIRVAPGQAGSVMAGLRASIPAGGGSLSLVRPVQAGLEDVFIALSEETVLAGSET